MTLLDQPEASQRAEKPAPLRRNRDFLLLWTGAGLSQFGVRAAVSAYPLLMLWYTGSPSSAGLVGFAALLPQLFLLLPAGALVDRWDRRRLMMVCDAVGLASMGSLAAALWFGVLSVPHVMAAAFLEGGAVIFYKLAERAAVRHVVHEDHLAAALSQNEARGQAAGLLGQPTGAVLFQAFRWLPFGVAAFTHLFALITLLLIPGSFQDERAEAEKRSVRAEIGEGIAWVWRQRFMRAAIIIVGGSNLLFQVLNLALVLIVKEGGYAPSYMAVIGVIEGVGGIAGALTASWFMKRLPLPALLIGALVVWAALMAGIAVTGHPVVLGALCAGTSWAGALLNVAAGVHQVRVTPDAMQGRATSVFGLVGSGMNSLGALVGGFLLAAAGAYWSVLAAAAGMALLALAALATPAVRRMGEAG
ncbi:MFS transporter [Streptomyces sp. NPDC006172]|uniref:MFS transporter n=1 Tax=Streptomyces sp. NPDC006172 TaxID=3154470 RepID=UPI0033D52DC1